MATARMTFARGSADGRGAVARAAAGVRGTGRERARWRAYQPPTCTSTAMAMSAAAENHAMLDCPCGTTTNAASRGPEAEPTFPPTWNSDCARPYLPPAAMRATREASGWKTDEPIPISIAARRIRGYVDARDIRSRPTRVRLMPAVREYGCGRRSVKIPTTGCSIDAVN